MTAHDTVPAPRRWREALTVFRVFLHLGLTSFGGPVAHLGYFRTAFVTRLRWLDEGAYADLVALCQFLPGPASSQVGMAIGLQRAGYPGAFAAWLGFTLPSAVFMVALALGLAGSAQAVPAGVLHGLKLVAVGIVAQAVWGMARTLCVGAVRSAIALAVTALALVWSAPLAQPLLIALAGFAGLLAIRPPEAPAHRSAPSPIGRRAGTAWLLLFFALLAGLPLAAQLAPEGAWARFDAFYRAGALVFGGGHVVLPLLQAELLPHGWVDPQVFLAGYGAVQAMPGPLFSFAGYVGASLAGAPTGVAGALLALGAIFLPAFLLVAGTLPFAARLQRQAPSRAALAGINAGVVGLLGAALVDPVGSSALARPADFAFAAVAFALLLWGRVPPWAVVLAGALAGGLVYR